MAAIVPISALQGHNVVSAAPRGWCGYRGDSLLDILQTLPADTMAETTQAFAFPVQWIEKLADANHTDRGRRIFWGRVASPACCASARP